MVTVSLRMIQLNRAHAWVCSITHADGPDMVGFTRLDLCNIHVHMPLAPCSRLCDGPTRPLPIPDAPTHPPSAPPAVRAARTLGPASLPRPVPLRPPRAAPDLAVTRLAPNLDSRPHNARATRHRRESLAQPRAAAASCAIDARACLSTLEADAVGGGRPRGARGAPSPCRRDLLNREERR